MSAYFFDSSSLVKRFARERGSGFVLGLLRPSMKNILLVTRITEVEVCAALVRRAKGKTLTATEVSKGLHRLRRDLPRRFTQIAVSEKIIKNASILAEKYALRGYDAVQLASALNANITRISNDLPPLILVSADNELNDAAQAEVLTVENPNNYR